MGSIANRLDLALKDCGLTTSGAQRITTLAIAAASPSERRMIQLVPSYKLTSTEFVVYCCSAARRLEICSVREGNVYEAVIANNIIHSHTAKGVRQEILNPSDPLTKYKAIQHHKSWAHNIGSGIKHRYGGEHRTRT